MPHGRKARLGQKAWKEGAGQHEASVQTRADGASNNTPVKMASAMSSGPLAALVLGDTKCHRALCKDHGESSVSGPQNSFSCFPEVPCPLGEGWRRTVPQVPPP